MTWGTFFGLFFLVTWFCVLKVALPLLGWAALYERTVGKWLKTKDPEVSTGTGKKA